MPKIEIDYSNTIFYKIYCKDPSINDLYIGHTTNFVQRKHAHKQSCLNTKSSNYNCKLYDVIRRNKGWDNWKIEIIAFHECNDLLSAKKYEQKYFEEYKATLNSIEPIPKPKPKISKDIVEKKKPEVLYCDVCNIHLSSVKTQEIHNKTTKHLKKMSFDQQMLTNSPKNADKYVCEPCDFKCCKLCDYDRHILTRKHKMEINGNIKSAEKYECDICSKLFKTNSGLWKHRHKCSPNSETNIIQLSNNNMSSTFEIDKELLINMLLKNNDVMEKLLLNNQCVMEKMMEIMPNLGNNSNKQQYIK
jgi:hypothetical protein